jgi:transcription antitermination factor NusG
MLRDGLAWYAIRVRLFREQVVQTFLRERGYEVLLPLQRCRRKWSDRVKHVEVPLFPGYLFCRFDVRERLPILMIPSVAHIAGLGRTPVPVEEREIADIQTVVRSGLLAFPHPFIQVGQRVSIEYGPLRGLNGVLVELKKGHRVVVSVTLLQRSLAVDIDREWIGSAGSHPDSRERVGTCTMIDVPAVERVQRKPVHVSSPSPGAAQAVAG